MKVYRWMGFRGEAPGPHHQTEEMVAAPSKAAVARLAGVKRAAVLFNLDETGNAGDIETATARPGVIFWRGIGGRDSWTAAHPPERERGEQEAGRT